MSSKIPPIGIRLNNPGNIEWGSPWQGLVTRENSTYYRDGSRQQQRFCEFVEPAFGIRAIAMTLMTYHDKRKANDGSKIDTIREVIERWAPAFENDVRAYANHVQKVMCQEEGVCAVVDEVLDFRDYHTMRGLVVGIIAHENAGYKYPDAVVDEGLRRAGFIKPPKMVTTETVGGAAVPAVAAAATLAPVVEPVMKALQEQQENLSSGSWVRIGIAVVLMAGVAVVAYSQWKKRKAGAV
jgi:hypothetical protein